jgi:intracellular sulfur oxidation DsrE/DsrF family protein
MFYTQSSSRSIRSPMHRIVRWAGAGLFLLCCAAVVAAFRPNTPDPRLTFPRIHAAGGVLPVDASAEMPSATAVHKLFVDVDEAGSSHHGVNARLNTAAKILNLYALAGVPANKVRMVILFYGEGVNLALSDQAYREKFHQPNPNADLLMQLRGANVKMVACGQALGHQGFTLADIRPGMTLALSALTAREELQAAGYGSVPKEAAP